MIKLGMEKSKINYQNVPQDIDGWVDASQYLPVDFDLCLLKIKDRSRNEPGWSVGAIWDGLRVEKNENVLFWKKEKEQMRIVRNAIS